MGTNHQEAGWGGEVSRAFPTYSPEHPTPRLCNISSQPPHSLLAQISDVNQNSGPGPRAASFLPCRVGGRQGKVTPPPALFNQRLSSSHPKGTTVRREPTVRSLPSWVNPAGDWAFSRLVGVELEAVAIRAAFADMGRGHNY